MNEPRSSHKVSVILVTYLGKLNFMDRVSKNPQISTTLNIRPMGAELFHADGQTDMTKLVVAFRNFANAPRKRKTIRHLALQPPCVCVCVCVYIYIYIYTLSLSQVV